MLASNSHCTVSSAFAATRLRASLTQQTGLVSDYSVCFSACLLFGELTDGENFLTLLLTAERSYPASSPKELLTLDTYKVYCNILILFSDTTTSPLGSIFDFKNFSNNIMIFSGAAGFALTTTTLIKPLFSK